MPAYWVFGRKRFNGDVIGRRDWLAAHDFVGPLREADFARSREMTLAEVLEQPWWFRAASRAAHLTAPVL